MTSPIRRYATLVTPANDFSFFNNMANPPDRAVIIESVDGGTTWGYWQVTGPENVQQLADLLNRAEEDKAVAELQQAIDGTEKGDTE